MQYVNYKELKSTRVIKAELMIQQIQCIPESIKIFLSCSIPESQLYYLIIHFNICHIGLKNCGYVSHGEFVAAESHQETGFTALSITHNDQFLPCLKWINICNWINRKATHREKRGIEQDGVHLINITAPDLTLDSVHVLCTYISIDLYLYRPVHISPLWGSHLIYIYIFGIHLSK